MTKRIIRYLIEYGKPKHFAFHWYAEEFVGVKIQLYNTWIVNDLLTCLLRSFTYLLHIFQRHLQLVVC
jgi:hypothetical protein